jgi:hypothetical protein
MPQFFQSGFTWQESGYELRYYLRIEPLPRKPVRLIGFGRLKDGVWTPWHGHPYYGLGTLSIWKEKQCAPGEGRIEGGIIIKSRNGYGGGKDEIYSLAECTLPAEYDTYSNQLSKSLLSLQ